MDINEKLWAVIAMGINNELKGLARVLFENCVYARFNKETNTIVLELPENQCALLNEKHIERVNNCARQILEDLKIEINIARPQVAPIHQISVVVLEVDENLVSSRMENFERILKDSIEGLLNNWVNDNNLQITLNMFADLFYAIKKYDKVLQKAGYDTSGFNLKVIES